MTRFRAVLIVLGLLALAVPAAATSADRMLVGFQDDPSFRWLDTRDTNLTDAAQTGASIVRTTVYWDRIAPTRPTNATDPFDPAYQFTDLDDFVRQATMRGMTVMLAVWSTPGWANGGKGANYSPTHLSDYQNFMRALAARYSGRYPGYPFVGYYSVWNEPNLGQFLSPTYDPSGKPESPFLYAGLVRSGYAGVKAGNSRALVAIGETSPRGRLKATTQSGVQQTMAPGLFAQVLSTAKPRVKFDAWAHHPYSDVGATPTQRVRYPNVNLVQIPTFETNLNKFFHRSTTPIWVTEYGFQTKPGQPKGVTPAQQAAYLKQAIAIATKYKYLQMFIWFIFRDGPTSLWHSGVLNQNASKKPSFAAFTAAARPVDIRNPVLLVRPGTSNPVVKVPVWELLARDGAGTTVGATISVTYKGKNIAVVQPTAAISVDGWVSFKAPITKAKASGEYKVFLKIGDANGNSVSRTATVIAR
ncbi:MAG TPA: cellulase family glycosylhydrolase [Gaiellaceae bacterium]|nr:cellulase family glycosylhydrolase [Gaiellaceae bacterium]